VGAYVLGFKYAIPEEISYMTTYEEKIVWLNSINLDQYPPENFPVVAMVKEYRKHLADTMRELKAMKQLNDSMQQTNKVMGSKLQELMRKLQSMEECDKAAAMDIERLECENKKLREVMLKYFIGYMQDEAENIENCCAGQQQHEDAKAIRDILYSCRQSIGGNPYCIHGFYTGNSEQCPQCFENLGISQQSPKISDK
jgi:hypothetical protein